MNQAEHDALVVLMQWWRSKRPNGLALELHWCNPTINTTGGEEAALARAAARVSRLDAQREHPRYNQATLETPHAKT